MAKGNLKFSDTQSLKSFAESNSATKVDFVRNPKTGKLFASFDNGATAALAEKLDKKKSMVISEVTDEETDTTFLMVHNPSEVNVEQTVELV